MAKKRGENYQSRYDENFKKFLRENLSFDETGQLKSKVYVQVYIGIKGGGRNSKNIAIPVSHLSWFLSRGEWPRDGYTIDHKDDNSLNNKPDNLQELTIEDNMAKKRGKTNRSFGSSKYGHGITVSIDKRDGTYIAVRIPSRGETKSDKSIKIPVGRSKTLEEIEAKIANYIENDLNYDAFKDLFPPDVSN